MAIRPRSETGGPKEVMSGTTQKVPHRALITLCVMMGNLMQSLDSSIANVSLPYMQGTFPPAPTRSPGC